MERNKKTRVILLSVLLLAIGILIGFESYPFFNKKTSDITYNSSIRETDSGYKYINPLLLGADTGQGATQYNRLKEDMSSYIKTQISAGNASDVSVYFRNMDSGAWTGVNENDTYDPASMLKIAVLIASLKLSDSNPNFFNETVAITPQSPLINYDQYYPPKDPIVKGKVYTVKELLSAMIVESDNNALQLLVDLIGNQQCDKVLSDLQLPPLESTSTDYMTPKLYSRFYRILYNSTYLTQQLSEQALELLVQDDFPGGIYSGVPTGIVVAQKFGERTDTDSDGTTRRELHDCGIVYYQNDPYFLCVMTKGSDFTKLQPIISTISKITWTEVSKKKIVY